MTTMVERMAKAAWADFTGLGSFEEYQMQGFEDTEAENREVYAARLADWPDSNMIHPSPDAFRSAARAALTALLEPSEGMVRKAEGHSDFILPVGTHDNSRKARLSEMRLAFVCAIQAALDERKA